MYFWWRPIAGTRTHRSFSSIWTAKVNISKGSWCLTTSRTTTPEGAHNEPWFPEAQSFSMLKVSAFPICYHDWGVMWCLNHSFPTHHSNWPPLLPSPPSPLDSFLEHCNTFKWALKMWASKAASIFLTGFHLFHYSFLHLAREIQVFLQYIYSLLARKERPEWGLPYQPLELGRIWSCSAWILILKSSTEIQLSWLVSENWQQKLGSQQRPRAPAVTTPTHWSLHCEPSLCSGEQAMQDQMNLKQKQYIHYF